MKGTRGMNGQECLAGASLGRRPGIARANALAAVGDCSQSCASARFETKAREGELQSWPSQSAVASITMNLSSLAAGIEEAPSAPIAKLR